MEEKESLLSRDVDISGVDDEPFELRVRIQEARNLLQKKHKALNTYVEVRVGTEHYKTSVDMKTRDPSWGSQFRFGGPSKNSHLSLQGEVVKGVKISKVRMRKKDSSKSIYRGQKVEAQYKSRKPWLDATILDARDGTAIDIFYNPVKVVEIRVFNRSSIGSISGDKLIGVHHIPIIDVIKNADFHSRKWYRMQISPKDGLTDTSGEILVTMHVRVCS